MTYEADLKIIKNHTGKPIFVYKIKNRAFDPQNECFEKTSETETLAAQQVVY